jgi:O-antigen ligase
MKKRIAQGIGGRGLLGKVILGTVLVMLGIVVGMQIYDPVKRVIEAAVGLAFIAIVSGRPLHWSLSVFLLSYAFPFALKIGTSNVVFIPLLIILWFARVSMGNLPKPRGSIADRPIVLMILAFLLSFYNNPGGSLLGLAIRFTWAYFTAIGLYYLVVNVVRDEKRLIHILQILALSSLFIMVFCILEMIFPGRVIIPGWIYTPHRQALVMKNIRIAGPFFDYELLAEFLALQIPLLLMLYVRSRRMLFRFAYFALILLDFGILMATSTRGAFISLSLGMLYLAFIVRRDLNIVRIFAILGIALVLVLGSEMVVSKYTISGGMFARLKKTKFIGLIPDTRIHAWPDALERAREHLLVGRSPAWDFSRKIAKFHWPHNGYLFYLEITGLIGATSFIWLLFVLMKASVKLRARSLFDRDFPRVVMMMLHVDMVIFAVDELKIDFLRNDRYIYFVWTLFALVAATRNIIVERDRQRALEGSAAALSDEVEKSRG